MGLVLSAKYKDAPEYSMAYSSFFRLRRDIMSVISEELKEAYADTTYGVLHPEEYDKRIDALIEKYKVNKKVCDFLFASDYGAKISPTKCKAVYDLIKDEEFGSSYGYYYAQMSMNDFKELLKGCYEYKSYLFWE